MAACPKTHAMIAEILGRLIVIALEILVPHNVSNIRIFCKPLV
jgi:hypothetical protein